LLHEKISIAATFLKIERQKYCFPRRTSYPGGPSAVVSLDHRLMGGQITLEGNTFLPEDLCMKK